LLLIAVAIVRPFFVFPGLCPLGLFFDNFGPGPPIVRVTAAKRIKRWGPPGAPQKKVFFLFLVVFFSASSRSHRSHSTRRSNVLPPKKTLLGIGPTCLARTLVVQLAEVLIGGVGGDAIQQAGLRWFSCIAEEASRTVQCWMMCSRSAKWRRVVRVML